MPLNKLEEAAGDKHLLHFQFDIVFPLGRLEIFEGIVTDIQYLVS